MGERSFILDASTLIYLLAPRSSARATACFEWFTDLRAAGGRFYVPALAHHEAKRGADLRALRGDSAEQKALVQLSRSERVRVLSVNNRVLDVAATIWARAKSEGFTPDDNKLSGDVIIMAEARLLSRPSAGKTIVTENLSHFQRLGGIESKTFSTV